MKRAFLTFVMAAMLTASLTACTRTPADSNTQNSRARTGGTMGENGRYYADDNGDVYDRGNNDMTGMGDDLRRAADDVMDGVGNAMQDMTGR